MGLSRLKKPGVENVVLLFLKEIISVYQSSKVSSANDTYLDKYTLSKNYKKHKHHNVTVDSAKSNHFKLSICLSTGLILEYPQE